MKKQITTFLLVICYLIGHAQDELPFDDKTDKVTFTNTVRITGDKHLLFKYAQQFIANEDFDKSQTTRTKDKEAYYSTHIVDQAVTYQDEETGKLFGNGYVDYHYRDQDRFVVLFTYKIYVQDNQYRYVITDLIVREFVDAGKKNSDARVLDFPIEKFMDRAPRVFDRSVPELLENISKIKHNLKTAMLGKL